MRVFTVRQGHRYQARIKVRPFKDEPVNEGVILDKLCQAGFTDITVRKSHPGEYYAWATWTWPDDNSEVPDEIEAIEDVST